jgi:hypothetical protein
MSDVFLIGAGFSMAIGHWMPDTQRLGSMVIDQQTSMHRAEVNGNHSDICDGLSCDFATLPKNRALLDFEQWLSSLAEQQAYLYLPANLQRQALFEKLSKLVAIQINSSVEHTVQGGGPPEWLSRLVKTWHEKEMTIISLNYDTLIETTFDHLRTTQLAPNTGGFIIPSHEDIYPVPIRSATPAAYSGIFGSGAAFPVGATMTLAKLHGSTNWYWDESTRSAESIVQVGLRNRWGDLNTYGDSIPGKVPLVVPPTLVKGSFFDNPMLRELWHTAYLELYGARRIFVIGYSLPPADLLMRSMLQAAILDEDEIWIVNRSEEHAARFTTLGASKVHVDFCGDRPGLLESFVEWYVNEEGDGA